MLKNILNLNGAQQLSKKEQNAINGGAQLCGPEDCNESGCDFGCFDCLSKTYSCPGGYIECYYCGDGIQ